MLSSQEMHCDGHARKEVYETWIDGESCEQI